ncbi:MAG: ketopantoate reductase family protein [Promethearchaeota archaeon]
MTKKRIKIGFIGAGSLGSLFGGYLASLKSDSYSTELILFCRKNHADQINKNGLILNRGQTELIIHDIQAYTNPDDAKNILLKGSDYAFDFIFLTTKTYDIVTAILEYEKLIDLSKWLVILQNGIGNEEVISNYCTKNKIIRIVTSNGALLNKPGYVTHTGAGFTKVGIPFQKILNIEGSELKAAQKYLKILSELLSFAGIETIIVDDIIKECWEKVFVNVGINAIGALTRLKNGEMLENEGIKHIMELAIKEALKVAELRSINLSNKDFTALTYDVAKKTSENKNSMLQDILKGKKTEIDFINGRIVKLGEELGINTPVNESLTYLIKGLERTSL